MKKNNDIIQDTTAPPIILDTSETPVTIEKMLEAQRAINDKTNITFSIEKWKVNTLKKLALELSLQKSENVNYTDLIKEAIDKIYFIKEKENES
jgi:hypothetical protein